MMRSVLVLVLGGIVVFACGDHESTIDPAVAPSGPAFLPVAQVLVDRCGAIDCHGSRYRNLRVYGFGSQRLDPTDLPDSPDTTQAEADQDYANVVGVEPDIFRQVVTEGGSRPERLTFVRKARGAEAHKGGQPIVVGDQADTCLTSWLAGAVNAGACRAAVPRLANP
jgi:hypothetical protein